MKNSFRIILMIFGAMLIFNAGFLAISANFNAGILLTLAAGLILFLYGAFLPMLRPYRWLRYCMSIGLLLGCCLISLISFYGRTDTVTYREDALIVLGAAVKGDVPSYPLYTRLEAALRYHQRNPDALIVVSGGQGFQETITEAAAMERRLLYWGIPQENIIKEEKATSTYENFKYAKELLDQRYSGPYSVAFVTSDFHIFRSSRTAKALGLAATHCQAPVLWYTIPANYLRECAAVMKEFLIRY